MHAAGQVLEDIHLATHKSPVDGQLRGFVREVGSLPGLGPGSHGLEIQLHAVFRDWSDANEAQVVGVLREFGSERAHSCQ